MAITASGSAEVRFTAYNILRIEWWEEVTNYSLMKSDFNWKLILISEEYGAIQSTVGKNWNVKYHGNGEQQVFNQSSDGKVYINIGNNEQKILASGSTRMDKTDDENLDFYLHFNLYADITFNGEYIEWVLAADGSTPKTKVKLLDMNSGVLVETAPNFTDEDNPKITYYNKYGTKADLYACISFDGTNDNIPYREIPHFTYGEYTFNLTAAERETLRTYLGSSQTKTVYFFIKTDVNDTIYYNHVGRTCTMINAEPLLNPTVVDTGITSITLTGDTSKVIKGFNSMAYSFNAEGRKGASIVSYRVSCGGISKNYDNDKLYNVESGLFEFTVVDSRGITATKTIQLELINYNKLTCNLTAQLSTEGVLNFTVQGKYYNGSFGAVDNTLNLYIRYKSGYEEYGDWIELEPSLINTNYHIAAGIPNLDYRNAYTIQAKAVDKTGTVESIEVVIKSTPVFDWSATDFNFNVPVAIEGNTINDFVIETGTEAMGTNGTWYWRKWKSGKAECYGCRNYGNMAVSTAWGGLYRSTGYIQDLPSGLFVDIPEVIDVSFRNSNFGGWVAKYESNAPTAANTGSFIVVRPASATLSQVYLSFNVIGRWK